MSRCYMVFGHMPHNFWPSLWFFFLFFFFLDENLLEKRLFNNILDLNLMQTGEPDSVNDGKK